MIPSTEEVVIREYGPRMAQISGFGGGYEEACRKMVLAGLDWIDEHPDANLAAFSAFENVYGIINEETADAKALVEAMVAAASGCTGAMVQATVTHVLYIKKHGWDAYVYNMTIRPLPWGLIFHC